MLTPVRTTLCGLPSTSSKAVVMTGNASTARTIAHATRWVNESFSSRPASASTVLICLRRASSVPTGIVRNVVAVGIERLSFMYRASAAGGPLRATFSSVPASARAAA